MSSLGLGTKVVSLADFIALDSTRVKLSDYLILIRDVSVRCFADYPLAPYSNEPSWRSGVEKAGIHLNLQNASTPPNFWLTPSGLCTRVLHQLIPSGKPRECAQMISIEGLTLPLSGLFADVIYGDKDNTLPITWHGRNFKIHLTLTDIQVEGTKRMRRYTDLLLPQLFVTASAKETRIPTYSLNKVELTFQYGEGITADTARAKVFTELSNAHRKS